MAASAPQNERLSTSGAIISFLQKFLASPYSSITAATLAIKALILVYGVASFEILENAPPPGWLDIWNRWDASSYQILAEHGYQATSDDRFLLVFFPLYPWLVRIVGSVLVGPMIGAFIVSGVASIAAALLLYRLTVMDEGEKLAQWCVWFLLIFPTTFFLHIGYTESLFLALVLGCFIAARRERWIIAGVIGSFAALTRFNGLVLIPALAVEAWQRYRQERRWRWEWLWIGLIASGFCAYLLVNYRVTGNPWTFITFQREHFFRSAAWPWLGILKSFKTLAYGDSRTVVSQELLFTFLGLLCTVWCWRRLRPSYGVWMIGNWLLVTSTPYLLSVPRYTLMMFPVYILFARAAKHFFWRLVLIIWSLLFLGLFAANFARGYWAF